MYLCLPVGGIFDPSGTYEAKAIGSSSEGAQTSLQEISTRYAAIEVPGWTGNGVTRTHSINTTVNVQSALRFVACVARGSHCKFSPGWSIAIESRYAF